MDFLKVNTKPYICGIEIATTGKLAPSTIEGYQQFYNAIPSNTDFQQAHFGKIGVAFSEENVQTNAGPYWKQKLIFRFPATDSKRAERLEKFQKAKFIKIKLTTGRSFALGRNDFEQNANPVVNIKTDQHICEIEFQTSSIFTTGYIPDLDAFGLPVIFPINFNPD